MAVVKVRASARSKDLRLFEINADGIAIGERVGDYAGLLTGAHTSSLPNVSGRVVGRALQTTEIVKLDDPGVFLADHGCSWPANSPSATTSRPGTRPLVPNQWGIAVPRRQKHPNSEQAVSSVALTAFSASIS